MRERVEVYGRILDVLIPEADDESSDFSRLLDEAWSGRAFHTFYASTLLVLSSLRADALESGRSHPVFAALAVATPDDDAVTPAAVLASVGGSRARFWDRLRTHSVQTNETSRALVWLWPLALLSGSAERRPFALVDVGASAGLNLVADSMSNIWTDENGAKLDVVRAPRILERLGVDREPLDPSTDEEALWLRACVWPGQTARQARVEEAIDTWRQLVSAGAQDAVGAPRVRTGQVTDAAAVAVDVASRMPVETLVVAYQSIVREYLPPVVDAAYEASMRAWLAASPHGRALWLEFEAADHLDEEFPVAITAHFRTPRRPPSESAVTSLVLGRCDYHPRLLAPCSRAVREFIAAFS